MSENKQTQSSVFGLPVFSKLPSGMRRFDKDQDGKATPARAQAFAVQVPIGATGIKLSAIAYGRLNENGNVDFKASFPGLGGRGSRAALVVPEATQVAYREHVNGAMSVWSELQAVTDEAYLLLTGKPSQQSNTSVVSIKPTVK